MNAPHTASLTPSPEAPADEPVHARVADARLDDAPQADVPAADATLADATPDHEPPANAPATDAQVPLVPATAARQRTPPDPETAWRLLLTKACLPYRDTGRRTSQRVRERLEMDPVFRLMLERGWLPPRARVIEIGTELVGLYASLLHAARSAERHGLWPTEWPAAPSARAYIGLQTSGEPAAEVISGLSVLPSRPRLVAGDLQALKLPPCEVVLMLDALRRVERKAQRVPLQAARDALRPGGRLLLRVQDAGGYRGDRAGAWQRDLVAWLRGEQWPAGCNRPLGEWKVLLWRMGFNVEAVPLDWSLETGEVLLVCTLLAPV